MLTGFVNKPTSILLGKMEASPTLDKLVKYFRYDAARSITAKDYNISKKVSSRSFYEDVNSLIGFRGEQLRSILDPLKTKGKANKGNSKKGKSKGKSKSKKGKK